MAVAAALRVALEEAERLPEGAYAGFLRGGITTLLTNVERGEAAFKARFAVFDFDEVELTRN